MTTVEVAPPGPRPQIRIRSLPSCDPPYDDEREPKRWETANQLALDWPVPARTRQPPPTPAAAHLARTVAAAKVTAGTAGDAKLAVRLFAQVFVEVLNGYRPAAHLSRMTVPKEATNVVNEAVSGTGRVAAIRGGASSGGAGPQRRTVSGPRPVHGGVQRGGCTAPVTGLPDARAGRGLGGSRPAQSPGPAAPRTGPAATRGPGRPPSAPDREAAARGQTTERNPGRPAPDREAARGQTTERNPGRSAQDREAGRAGGRGPTGLPHAPDRGTAPAAAMRPNPGRRGAVDVLKFHFCEPRPGAVEATVLLLAGERTCALALRMELQGRRWMAAAVRLL